MLASTPTLSRTSQNTSSIFLPVLVSLEKNRKSQLEAASPRMGCRTEGYYCRPVVNTFRLCCILTEFKGMELIANGVKQQFCSVRISLFLFLDLRLIDQGVNYLAVEIHCSESIRQLAFTTLHYLKIPHNKESVS